MHVLVPRWPIVAGSLLLFASLGSSAQTLLSLSGAIERAEAHSADLEASRQAVVAARESAVAAGQLPDPQLRVGLDNLPVSGADRFSTTRDSMTMRRVGLAQEIVPSATRAARRTVGIRMAEREEAQARAARATVRKEAASAWLDANIAARALALLETLQAETRLQLSTFDSQVRAAKASPAAFAALQAAALQVDDRVLAARAELDLVLLTLARWVGEDVRVLPGGMPDFTRLPADAGLASVETPRQRAAHYQQALAQAELELTRLNKRPNWSWEVSFGQRPGYSEMISVGISIPLPLFAEDRQDRETAAREAMAVQAAAAAEEVRRSQRLEMRRLVLRWKSLLSRHDRLVAELLPVSRSRAATVLAAYGSGQATLAEVLLARQAEVETEIELLDHEREAARLWAQLTYQYLDADASGVHAGAHP